MEHKLLAFLTLFILNTSFASTKYYVNDASTTGDIYTIVTGGAFPGRNGLSPSTPVNTISAIVSNYVLGPGDTVFIDAGTYSNTSIVISAGVDAGSAAGNLVFIGAVDSSLTRVIATAAISNAVFDLTNTSYVTFCNMYIQTSNNRQCISLDANSDYCKIFNCTLYNPVNNGFALDFSNSSANTPDFNEVYQCTINSGAFGFRIKSTSAGIYLDGNIVRDNIIQVRTGAGPAFENNRVRNTKIYRNRIKDGDQAVLLDKDISGTKMYNNYITNIMTGKEGIYGPAMIGTGIEIIHNSIYSDGECFNTDNNVAILTGTIFKTNILFSISSNCILVKSNTLFQEINCNLFWHPSSNIANYVSANYTGLSPAWIGVDHDVRAGFNGDENSLEADPSFINAPNGNLDLNASSPALDAGCSVGVTDDIYMTSRPQNAIVDIGAFEFPVPLPIKLLNFKGDCQGDRMILTWATTSEFNNNYFTLEKSEDGVSYDSSAIIKGIKNSFEVQYYQYVDYETGKFIYRLKQTDIDGNYSYSFPICPESCRGGGIKIYIADNAIVVIVDNDNEDREIKISLTTCTGQILIDQCHPLTKGVNSIKIEKANYAPGIYMLLSQTNSQYISKKILWE